jgi:predicted enzyme related to lactoylglutathione lyase
MYAVVHLELHTRNLAAASGFYARLLNWQPERVDTQHGCYVGLKLGRSIDGGVVECGTERPAWLPYVEVDRIDAVTERARRLGASVLLGPREGPAGWRSVVASPDVGQVALWQPKEWQ